MSWTKVPNTYWEIEDELLPAEAKLLLRLIRLTEGYHVEWASIGETELVEQTKLPRTTLYRAKAGLLVKGLIEVDKTGATCAYRLGTRLSDPASPATPPVPPVEPRPTGGTPYHERHGGSHGRHGTRPTDGTTARPTDGTGCTLKESMKENSKETTSSLASEPVRNDDDFRKNDSISDDQADLVRELQAAGVDARMAVRMAQVAPGVARSELEALPHRPQVANPGGFLVAAVMSGGYGQPGAIVRKDEREHVHRRRRDERQADEQRRDDEQLRARLEWDHLVGQAGPDELAAAEAYARAQFRGAMATAPADSPHIRALILDFFRARESQQQVS